jgi:hypothetical protein
MNAENLQDAISLLPEEMLRDVDQLRQKKHTPWKGFVAAAACLCLLAGIWTLQNGGIKAENGSAAPDKSCESNSLANQNDGTGTEPATGNSQVAPMVATVVELQTDRIVVLPGTVLTDIAQPITVMLTGLEDVPVLTENQRIRIYYNEKSDPLIPYRIEVIDE